MKILDKIKLFIDLQIISPDNICIVIYIFIPFSSKSKLQGIDFIFI